MKNKELISPISFVKGQLESDSRLNSMFMMSYETKLVSDVTSSRIIDSCKKDLLNSGDRYAQHMIASIDNNAFDDSIMSYIISNVLDLTINTLVRASSNVYGIFSEEELAMIPKFNIEVDKVKNIIARSIHAVNNTENIELNYVLFNSLSDSIFAHLLSDVFEPAIGQFTVLCGPNSGKIYKAMFKYYFNSEPNNVEDPGTVYTFISSIVRDIFQVELIVLREALVGVAHTCSAMLSNRMDWANNIDNPEVNTEQILLNNCLLHNLSGKLLEEDKNE